MRTIRKALTLLAVAVLALAGPASDAAAQVHHTRVNWYETPCELRVRQQHGVPEPRVDGSGMVAWVRSHIINGNKVDATLAAFNRDSDWCDEHQPVARWDWDRMILIHVEWLP